MYTTKQKGFTIVELLIVIVVIAILAAISIVAFTGIQQRGRDSQRASDVGNITKSLVAYTTDGNDWPADGPAAGTALRGYTTAAITQDMADALDPGSTATSTPSTTEFKYETCTTGGSVTGARISYQKEQDNSIEEQVAGSC